MIYKTLNNLHYGVYIYLFIYLFIYLLWYINNFDL